MKYKILKAFFIFILTSQSILFADRQLTPTEISHILQCLTAQPYKTWIPAGTITATHEEYKAAVKDSNQAKKDFKLLSNVIVRFDGERFYWQIDAVSDGSKEQAEQFDFYSNGIRIFSWDGQKYSTYARPVNCAIINDAETLKIPRVLNGPLNAGCIPWGYGNYSFNTISEASACGVETVVDNQKQVQLALILANGTEMVFSLDPEKNYAVLSHQTKNSHNIITLRTYGNFQLIGSRWIPQTIMIEQYKFSIAPENLIGSDLWNFTSISSTVPDNNGFKINYEKDALIEYFTQLAPESLLFRYFKNPADSAGLDSDVILMDKMDFDAQAGSLRNCAMADIKYAAAKFEKNIAYEQLSSLAQDPNGTSMYAMKQFILNQGLYCRAVKTDIQSLRNLANTQAILHFPDKNHYVVLGNIDSVFVRVIDLADRKFFDRLSLEDFKQEWQGTALLISNQPINAQLADITDSVLEKIFGTGYTCTKLLQAGGTFRCNQMWGYCGGTEAVYQRRYGCEPAPQGNCSMSLMWKSQEIDCADDINATGNCVYVGDVRFYFMRACR